ncbi:SMP-30/gluconolactonase/LRE family protein [Sphingomonas sp. T9W2]|uniref:SMP-30/gluconolactonase/LRE family protein n=1 Tax=Sphingomonas sp. T9W2 TaxID=3143183 RepID=UPI0031F4BCD7
MSIALATPIAPLLLPARLRPPGPPAPTDVPPPMIHHADARAVLDGARLVTLYDQANWSEGPAWWPRERTLVWSDIVGRRVLGRREDGAVDVLLDATPFINGNAVLPDGGLVHCEHGRRAISRSEGMGVATPIAWMAEGSRLNAPNDVIVGPDGAIWFSDPTFGLENPKQGVPTRSESRRTAICRIGEDGVVRRMTDMTQPNGLAFSPDGRIFYASQTPEHGEGEVAIHAFDWDGTALSNQRRFATVDDGIPDGFTVDRRGWLWSSSGKGIELFDAVGTHLATVPTPGMCSNCTFDSDETRLFVTGGACLWMLPLA